MSLNIFQKIQNSIWWMCFKHVLNLMFTKCIFNKKKGNSWVIKKKFIRTFFDDASLCE